MTKKKTRGQKPGTLSPVEKSHLLNHDLTPEPVKRSAGILAASMLLGEAHSVARERLATLLDMLDLWPEDNRRFHADEGLVAV